MFVAFASIIFAIVTFNYMLLSSLDNLTPYRVLTLL
jgi:hypothetical protein